MAKPREDNGWWAEGVFVVGADGDAIAECYWNPVLGGNNEPVTAEERAARIARLPDLEAENVRLRMLLRELVKDVYTGLNDIVGDDSVYLCRYCLSEAPLNFDGGEVFPHTQSCPVRRAREEVDGE